jgi:hypothetical protein
VPASDFRFDGSEGWKPGSSGLAQKLTSGCYTVAGSELTSDFRIDFRLPGLYTVAGSGRTSESTSELTSDFRALHGCRFRVDFRVQRLSNKKGVQRSAVERLTPTCLLAGQCAVGICGRCPGLAPSGQETANASPLSLGRVSQQPSPATRPGLARRTRRGPASHQGCRTSPLPRRARSGLCGMLHHR